MRTIDLFTLYTNIKVNGRFLGYRMQGNYPINLYSLGRLFYEIHNNNGLNIYTVPTEHVAITNYKEKI